MTKKPAQNITLREHLDIIGRQRARPGNAWVKEKAERGGAFGPASPQTPERLLEFQEAQKQARIMTSVFSRIR